MGADTEDAVLYQTIAGTQTGVEHFLEVLIEDAPLRLQIGTSGQSSSDILDEVLPPGFHHLAFTPDADVTLTFSNNQLYSSVLSHARFAGAGDLVIETPVPLANVDEIQMDYSAGQIFCWWSDEPFVIERRGPKSWSVVEFRADDGPFDTVNLDETLTLQPSAQTGDVTITSSEDHFKPGDVGSLRRLVSSSQRASVLATVGDTGTDSIYAGGTEQVKIYYRQGGAIAGNAKVYLQRSVDDTNWTNLYGPFDNAFEASYDDLVNGAFFYYRLFAPLADFGAGAAAGVSMEIWHLGGSIEGVARITGYTSATQVSAQVLSPFGDTNATSNWYVSQWGGENGWPNSTILYEGRLWAAGKSGIWASVSDDYQSFDRDREGVDRSIYRAVGSGPVDDALWMGNAVRLAVGYPHDTLPVRSSSFGEAITQDNISVRRGARTGAAPVQPIENDNVLFFVQRNATKVCRLTYDGGSDSHQAIDETTLADHICQAGVEELAILREPENRLVVRLADGSIRVLLDDATEDVRGWSRISFDPQMSLQRIATLPEFREDRLYAVIETGGLHYLCKMGLIEESHLLPVDMYVRASGQTITGLGHLEGITLEAWSNGVKLGDYVVNGGQVNLGSTQSDVVIGLPFTSTYRSIKLSRYQDRTSLAMRKRVVSLGVYMRDLYRPGFRFGGETGRLDNLPRIYRASGVDDTALINVWDTQPLHFDGSYDVDSAIILESTGPARVLGMAIEFDDCNPTREA